MRTITVTALEDCVYKGQYFNVGTELELPAVDAAALRYQGKVALASDEDKTNAALAKRHAAVEAPPKRRYRRRNLTAQD